MLLAAVHFTFAQSTEPQWKSVWERGDFQSIASDAEAQGAGPLGEYVSEVARLLCPESGVVDPDQLPKLPDGVGAFWESAEPLISAIACQRAYRFEEAQHWAEFALTSMKAGSALHARAALVQEQCANARTAEQAWAPLRPLDAKSAPKSRLLESISSGESGGRWVPVPDELRSRHDRRSGFQDDLFITPGSNRAWFASDRTGDGDTDLYVVELLPDGDFGQISEAAAGINSPYAEQSPWWQPGSDRVYFSSDRPASLGGLDVFFVELNSEVACATPLPFAINSAFNETHFTPHDDRWTAWFLSDRVGQQAYRVVREFESRKPVKLTIQLPELKPAQGEMKLDLWDADSEHALWSGVVAGGASVRLVVPDGTRVLALLSNRNSVDCTWQEWQVPVVAVPSRWTVALQATPEIMGLQAPECEVDTDLDPWPVEWSLARASRAPHIPRTPVENAALPKGWEALGATSWWQKATSEERSVVVRALNLIAEQLELPAAPSGGGWTLVEEGLEWNAMLFNALTSRQQAFQQALDLVCESDNLEGWEDACAEWIASREADRWSLEKGMIWFEMSQTLSPLHALAKAHSMTNQTDLDWFSSAEIVMLRSMNSAYREANWQHLLETKEVWRDWLFAHWEALMSNQEAANFKAEGNLRAFWEMEQSFANPVWNNLESFARALLHLLPGCPDTPSAFDAPMASVASSLNRAMQPFLNAQAGDNLLAFVPPNEAESAEDSIYTIQLGAFEVSPNPWAFHLPRKNLKQISLDGWNKVFYGDFYDKDSAREFLKVIWAGRGFEDAFIKSFARNAWESIPYWNADRELVGHGVEGRHYDAFAARPEGGWAWPAEEGGWSFWYGPFTGDKDVTRWIEAAEDGIQWQRSVYGKPAIRNVPAGQPVQPAPPRHPQDQPIGPAAPNDASRWVIRVAEFPSGAPASARAALLRLPAQVRSIPWGMGDAFITYEIQGEEEALKLLKTIQSQGFPDARLLPVHVD